MQKISICAALGSVFIAAAASSAAELITPPAGPPPTVSGAAGPPSHAERGATRINPTGQPILLEAGKGTLIRLDRPVSGGTVFIANPDVADVQIKSPSLIYLSAKAPGETVLYAVDADDRVLLNTAVRVAHDITRLRESMHYLMPGENISVKSVENSLVLSGNISTAARAEKARTLASAIAADVKGAQVVDQLSVATSNQVNLRVRVAEVNRTLLKSLGINFSKPGGSIRIEGTGTSSVNTSSNGGASLPFTGNPVTGGQITAQNLLGLLIGRGTGQTTAVLDALAQEGLITTLAEPNLTATNGQPASFLAGGEFPVPVAVAPASGTAGTTISVAFKTFGVSLDFTPTILDANHLSLRVRPEVSQLTTTGSVQITGFSIPALTVRRAETTVELASGESFALAGLLQNTTTQNISKIPALGDLPVIGQLFRSELFQRDETELVIIVTPYLVKPSVTAMAAPTDGFVPPHDGQRLLDASTYRQGLPAPPKTTIGNGQGLIGPAGFRLD